MGYSYQSLWQNILLYVPIIFSLLMFTSSPTLCAEKQKTQMEKDIEAIQKTIPKELIRSVLTPIYIQHYYQELFDDKLLIPSRNEIVDLVANISIIPVHWKPTKNEQSCSFNIYDPLYASMQWANDTYYFHFYKEDIGKNSLSSYNPEYKKWLYIPFRHDFGPFHTLIDACSDNNNLFFLRKSTILSLATLSKPNGKQVYQDAYTHKLVVSNEKSRITNKREQETIFFEYSSPYELLPQSFCVRTHTQKANTPIDIAVVAHQGPPSQKQLTLWLKNQDILQQLPIVTERSPGIFTKIAFMPGLSNVLLGLHALSKDLYIIKPDAAMQEAILAKQTLSFLTNKKKEYVIDFAVDQMHPKHIALLTRDCAEELHYSIYMAQFFLKEKRGIWKVRHIANFSNKHFIHDSELNATYPYAQNYFKNMRLKSSILAVHNATSPICFSPFISYKEHLVTIGTKVMGFKYEEGFSVVSFAGLAERYIYIP